MSEAVLILAHFSRDALAALESTVPVTYESWTDTLRLQSPEELARRIDDDGISVLVVEADFVFDDVLRQPTPLRFLGVCRNGLDHLDVEAATRSGVAVVNTPGRNARAVAELTIGLMISLARGIPRLDGYVKGGRWENPVEPYLHMRGVELEGKTLGIVGLGAIGRTVARLGGALGMRVIAYDPYVAPSAGPSNAGKDGAVLGGLDWVLQASDFVSVHVPLSDETRGLIDRRSLGTMKPGSYVINTAAYPVIEEAALVESLESGRIAGAALDVHPAHPIPPTSPLLKLDNVILTPHIGGATEGTVERQSWMMVEDIQRFLQGHRPLHLVNEEVWTRRG